MSTSLATALKKVLTPWTGLQIRAAECHLITSVCRVTAQMKAKGLKYIGNFDILPECWKGLFLV